MGLLNCGKGAVHRVLRIAVGARREEHPHALQVSPLRCCQKSRPAFLRSKRGEREARGGGARVVGERGVAGAGGAGGAWAESMPTGRCLDLGAGSHLILGSQVRS